MSEAVGCPCEGNLRFLGTGSGRRLRYARLLAEALEPSQVPASLARLVDSV
jgi:hypothetical protein